MKQWAKAQYSGAFIFGLELLCYNHRGNTRKSYHFFLGRKNVEGHFQDVSYLTSDFQFSTHAAQFLFHADLLTVAWKHLVTGLLQRFLPEAQPAVGRSEVVLNEFVDLDT